MKKEGEINMKKLVISAMTFAVLQTTALAEDLAWRDVGAQQTPIGAGQSRTGILATFDSWGSKDLVADGTFGTSLSPFVSLFLAVWTSEAMALDLLAPGFWISFR
ncbi:MAG: hypothetical protein IKF72_11730 [Kiritimatiellae bacterium]|nr:hypothetical protein [Kiritimatiellia bacterium]